MKTGERKEERNL